MIGSALLKTAAEEARREVSRLVARAIVLALVGLLVLIAVVFGCLAAYLALAQHWPPPYAALAVAGGILVLALAVLIAGRAATGARRRPRMPPVHGAAVPPTPDAGAGAGAGTGGTAERAAFSLGETLGRHPRQAAITAFVTGLAIGGSPELRRALADALVPPRRR